MSSTSVECLFSLTPCREVRRPPALPRVPALEQQCES
jgi:hypothetical protein